MPAEDDNTSKLNKKMLPLLILLTAAGLAGNHFRYEIIFNIQFVFGSIFSLFILLFSASGPESSPVR